MWCANMFSFLSSPAFDCCFTLVARYTATLADLGPKVSAHQLELLSAQNHNASLSHLFFSSSSSSSSSTMNSSSVNTLLSTVSAYPTSEDALPLFGPICFSLTAQPDSVHKPIRCGLLWVRVGATIRSYTFNNILVTNAYDHKESTPVNLLIKVAVLKLAMKTILRVG